jgi:hypothetical protein
MCPYELGDENTTSDDDNEPENLEELGSPSPGDALLDAFEPTDYTLVEGPDGLPVEAMSPYQAQDTAPIPLTPETVVCLAQDPSPFNKEPIAVCRYYRRQRVHNPKAPDRPMIQRFCTVSALRGINGACMALDDAGIYDCEFRDPPHPRAALVLDRIDRDKIKKGRERLIQERRTGKTHGYRMFRTPEDVAAGRYVVDETDMNDGELQRAQIDPLADDDPAEASAAAAETSSNQREES